MRQLAPGFRAVSCVSRQIEAPGEVSSAAASPPVLQSIYSDGLTYVSVFIEPFRPERHTRPVLIAVGATSTLARRQGDWWVTVVGDTPPGTLRMFAAALERKKP
jgi:sigma-E factor negative regulatory protein RseB